MASATTIATPIYMFGMTGMDFTLDPRNGYDGRVLDAGTIDGFMDGRLAKALELGERSFLYGKPGGAAPSTPGDNPGDPPKVHRTYGVNEWTGALPHVREYFRKGRWKRLAPSLRLRFAVYAGVLVTKDAFPLERETECLEEGARPFLTAPWLGEDQRARIAEREYLPWVALGMHLACDALDVAGHDALRRITDRWDPPGALGPPSIMTEAHPLKAVGKDADGPGGVLYDLDLSRPEVPSMATWEFHARFDRQERWEVPAGVVRHCIIRGEVSEELLVSLHDRGFILGIWDDDRPLLREQAQLVRKIRSRPRARARRGG